MAEDTRVELVLTEPKPAVLPLNESSVNNYDRTQLTKVFIHPLSGLEPLSVVGDTTALTC